jgi:hypothetical protein
MYLYIFFKKSSQIIKKKMPIKFSPEKISRLYIQESGEDEHIKKVEAASLGIKTGTKIYAIWKHTKTQVPTDCEVEVIVTPEFLQLENDVCKLWLQVCELRYQRVPGVIHKAGTYKSYFLNATTLMDAKGNEIGWRHVLASPSPTEDTATVADEPVDITYDEVAPPAPIAAKHVKVADSSEKGSAENPIVLTDDSDDESDSDDDSEDSYEDDTKEWAKKGVRLVHELNEKSIYKTPIPACLTYLLKDD